MISQTNMARLNSMGAVLQGRQFDKKIQKYFFSVQKNRIAKRVDKCVCISHLPTQHVPQYSKFSIFSNYIIHMRHSQERTLITMNTRTQPYPYEYLRRLC
jgi:hypothetical protein